jgi:hypothetical protein
MCPKFIRRSIKEHRNWEILRTQENDIKIDLKEIVRDVTRS